MATEEVFPEDTPELEEQFKLQDGDGIVPELRKRASFEQFQSWLRDLESYFKCNQVYEPEKKYSILMIHGGPFLNEIARTKKLAERGEYPIYKGEEEQIKRDEARKLRDKHRKGTVDVYEDTKKILVDNFVPNSNEIVERMKFLATEPRIGESDEAFLNRLIENSMFCGYDNGYSSEDAIVEQFMEKCIWCNLKTRLAFESKLTISKILEIADDMSRRMPPGEDLRFQMPGESELQAFPITHSLERTKGNIYKPYKLEDFYDKNSVETVPDPEVPCLHCETKGHVPQFCILKDKHPNNLLEDSEPEDAGLDDVI
ncbi:uncharacterized protein LOC134817497 [Bolinopsis microptera]|uniref:uncharacterized protein LOC134817497 n=1 Tax=Bolinopsis microptera TaxID=2820187 RepID=UPI00307A4066